MCLRTTGYTMNNLLLGHVEIRVPALESRQGGTGIILNDG